MPLSIRRSRQAKIDQSDIWLNVAVDSIRAADDVLARLDDVVRTLAEHPEAGRNRDDLRVGVRYFPVESLLIFYTVAPHALEIRRILHGAREITPDLFDE